MLMPYVSPKEVTTMLDDIRTQMRDATLAEEVLRIDSKKLLGASFDRLELFT